MMFSILVSIFALTSFKIYGISAFPSLHLSCSMDTLYLQSLSINVVNPLYEKIQPIYLYVFVIDPLLTHSPSFHFIGYLLFI